MLESGSAAAAAASVWGSVTPWDTGPQVGGVSGGFEFPTAEEMNTVLGLWRDRQQSLTEKKAQIIEIKHSLLQLAGDQESRGYLETAHNSLDLLEAQHNSMLAYIDDYIQKLTTTTNSKQNNEADTVEAIDKGR